MILIVEDNAELASVYAKALIGAGHQIHVAGCAETALVFLSATLYDMAIVDLALPDFNGAEMAIRARGMGCHIPMIAISGAMPLIDPRDIARSRVCHDNDKAFTNKHIVGIG